MNFKLGDLLMTTENMVVRRDGFTFNEADCEGGKVSRDWLNGADTLDKGSYCTFVRMSVDDERYAIVSKGVLGRAMTVMLSRLELIQAYDEDVTV